MNKKILNLLLALALAFSQISPIAAEIQKQSNPFIQQDINRKNAIQSSLQISADQLQLQPAELTRTSSAKRSTLPIGGTGDDTYTVKFKIDTPLIDIFSCVEQYNYSLITASENRLFKIQIENLSQFKTQCDEMIEDISKSVSRKADILPDDPMVNQQWALSDIRLPEAWNTTTGKSSVKVAVIDTGFYRGHEDLSNGIVLAGYDLGADIADVSTDEIGHGTMVTSVIAAIADNGIGMAGSCWDISVVPYKIAQYDTDTDEYAMDSADLIEAIYMAADSGCSVINMSLGGYESDSMEQAAINYAVGKGCIVIASSGNEGDTDYRGRLSYPASDKGVISVGAVSPDNQRSVFSQYNSEVDVVAPGEHILVCGSGAANSYKSVDGTSFSSPYVAGVAALIRSMEPSVTAPFFEQLIRSTSKDYGNPLRDDYYGWGLIDAQKMAGAVQYPIVYGVEEGRVYYSAKTIFFNKGTATLNGQPFTGNSTYSNGTQTLVVTDGNNHATTVHFTIDTTQPVITGIQDGGGYNTDRTITFSRGTATLNGNPFVSGTTVIEEGSYVLRLTGSNILNSNYNFVIDKTPPVITGVADGASYDLPVYISFNEGNARFDGYDYFKPKWIKSKGVHTLQVYDRGGNTVNAVFTITRDPLPVVKADMGVRKLTKWVYDESGDTIFAIDKINKQLYCINGTSLAITQHFSLAGSPTDMVMDAGKIYIALGDAKQIVVVDAAGRSIESILPMATGPNKIVKNGDSLYFTALGYWSSIYEYSLSTKTEKKLDLGADFYQPDIEVNTSLQQLYISESELSDSHLYYYDLQMKKMSSVNLHDSMYNQLFFDGTSLVCGFLKRDTVDPERILGEYPSNIRHSFNNVLFTQTAIYDEETMTILTLAGNELVESSSTGCLYTYSNGTVTRYQSADGPISAKNICSLILAAPVPPIPDNAVAKRITADKKTLTLGSEISQWELDSLNNVLCAMSNRSNALFFINPETLDIEKTIHLRSSPNDMKIDNGKIYVALQYINQIQVFDIATGMPEASYRTMYGPYRFAKSGDSLFYMRNVEDGLYGIDLLTGTETRKKDIPVMDPVLLADTDTGMLYIGESRVNLKQLFYYDISEDTLVQKTKDNYFTDILHIDLTKFMFIDNESLFFSGKAFDLTDPDKFAGCYGSHESIIYAGNGVVATSSAIYDEASYRKLGTFNDFTDLFTITSRGDIFSYSRSDLTITRVEGNGIPVGPDNIASRTDVIVITEIPSSVQNRLVSPGERVLDAGFEISGWTMDQNDNLLAISENEKSLFFIDGQNFEIRDRLRFDAAPSDIVVENGKAYIAFEDIYRIEVVDIAAKAVQKIIETEKNPYRLAIDGTRLFYSQKSPNGSVGVIDMDTGAENIAVGNVYNPSLAINRLAHILYIGESYIANDAHVHYFDYASNKLIGTSLTYPSFGCTIFFDGVSVYYAGKAFDPMNPDVIQQELGEYEEIIYAKNGYIVNQYGDVYDAETFSYFTSFETPPTLMELSSHDDLYLYDSASQQIERSAAEPVTPEITGVIDGEACFDAVTISFDIGTADLDGTPFLSGETVISLGEHILTITDSEGFETLIQFTIIPSGADDNIPVNIPDQNLKLALMECNADKNSNGELSRGELRQLTGDLYLFYYDITELEGLQYVTGIEYLDISGNNITDISALASLTQLKGLDVSYNAVSKLAPIEGLLNLTDLILDCNEIADISALESLCRLSYITLSDNRITDVDALSSMQDIRYLDLSYNEISDISSLAALSFYNLYDLDENRNSSIHDQEGALVDLSDNPLTDISPLSNKGCMQFLDLSNTLVTDYSALNSIPGLHELDASYNGLTSVDPFIGLTLLDFLYLDGNRISDITNLRNLSNLTGLSLANNELRNIEVIQYLVNSLYLDLSDNKLDDISVFETQNLFYSLDLSGNELGSIASLTNLLIYNYLDVSENFLDFSEGSTDIQDIEAVLYNNEYCEIVYEPQKDSSMDIPPVITINPYNKTLTNKSIVVTAATDKGNLNEASHTFEQNGSFDFIATDSVGKSTKVTVTITNIDKTAPVISAKDSGSNAIPDNGTALGSVTVVVSGETTKTAKKNDAAVSWPQNDLFTETGRYAITAVDAAGNSSTKNFTINPAEIQAKTGSTVKIAQTTGFITNIAPKTTVSELLSRLNTSAGTYKVLNSKGVAITTGSIGTGTRIQLLGSRNQVVDELTVVIYGDVNGDGSVNALDLLAIKKKLLGQSQLTGASAEAGNINRDASGVNALDLLAIKKQLLGQKQIIQ
ncbi:MAG: S8 family serine peptidase [Saccharofermentanales bacterium]